MATPGDAFPTLLTKRLLACALSASRATPPACTPASATPRPCASGFPTCKTISNGKVLAWLGKTTSPLRAPGLGRRRPVEGPLHRHAQLPPPRGAQQTPGARLHRRPRPPGPRPRHRGDPRGARLLRRTLGAHRVHAYQPENRASIKLGRAPRLPLRGRPLTDYWCVAGRYLDAMLWAFIAPATRAAAPAPRAAPGAASPSPQSPSLSHGRRPVPLPLAGRG